MKTMYEGDRRQQLELFEGEFNNGEKNGPGILTKINGDTLKGIFKDDKMVYSEISILNGNTMIFFGPMLESKREGRGTNIWLNNLEEIRVYFGYFS